MKRSAGDGRQAGSQARGLLLAPSGGEHLEPPEVVRSIIKRKDDRSPLEERRREQIREFAKELHAGRPAPVLLPRFKQWHFPHHGKEGKSCGAKVFFAHDNPSGPGHFWAAEMPCRNRTCPTCGPVYEGGRCVKAGAWETRIARQWQSEIKWWMNSEEAEALAVQTHQRKLPVAHIVVSVHPKDWDNLPEAEKTREALADLRAAAHRYARKAGLVGAYWALHGRRVPSKWNHRSCAIDGLHFHYVGVTRHRYGRVDGEYVKRLHHRKGWILKRIGLQDSFFGTALYQLSHATWAEYTDGEDPDDAEGVFQSHCEIPQESLPPSALPPSPRYPALVHNSENPRPASQVGRSCGRIGWFLGLGGQAPPVALEEDTCLVCGHDVPPSMRYEVWRLADAPPPGAAGELNWDHWTDMRPEPGAAAIVEAALTRRAQERAAAALRCTCDGGTTPKKGCCSKDWKLHG